MIFGIEKKITINDLGCMNEKLRTRPVHRIWIYEGQSHYKCVWEQLLSNAMFVNKSRLRAIYIILLLLLLCLNWLWGGNRFRNGLIFYLSLSIHRSVWRTIFLGQLLSLLLCAFQYVSHHLSTSLEMTIFTSQNYLRYMTTCCVFTTMLAFRSGENSLFNVIKTRGYRYILIGLVDLEANTLVGMSHQFSSLINIQVR